MLQSTLPATAIDHPLVHFGREVCGDLATGLRREWIVTNGLGGYASSTLAGVNTRRYHGLLDAAHVLLQPFEDHLRDAGLGTISEILAGYPPHLPNGCVAQAWGVAEIMRVWRELER